MTDAIFPLLGLNGENGFVIKGIDRDDDSGSSVSSAGDVNGDGIDDLIIGAPGTGESYVVFGSSGGFASSVDLSTLDGQNGFVIKGIDRDDDSGSSVSSAGDVNGDGIDDLIIGADDADPNGNRRAGESYVVFGSSGGFASSVDLSTLDGRNGFVIQGIDDYDRSGSSVSSAGDVNGDGIDDLIIGAPWADLNGKSYAGESYVVFGSSGGFARSLDLSTLDGRNGFVIQGIEQDDRSGSSVSSAGDVNGDGIDDLIIGAPLADPNGKLRAGESYVVFGSSGGFASSVDLSTLDGRDGFVIQGIDAVDSSGSSVSSAGDVNGDGIDDLIIGATGAYPNGNRSAGESYVVFGSSGGFASSVDLSTLDGRNGFVIQGIDEFDSSGRSVSSAGDVNGDGIDDLIIGAPALFNYYGNRSAGESYVVFGSSEGFAGSLDLSTLDGRNGFVIQGIEQDDRSGFSVSSAGDVNGDGIDDLIIGAPFADPNGKSLAGESYVVFGSNSGFAPLIGELIEDKFSATNSFFQLVIDDNVFRDLDGDILTYSTTLADNSPLPSWLTFDPNAVTFSGTPLSSDTGVLEIKLTATDSSNNSTSINFTLTVTDTLFPEVFELQLLNGRNGFVIQGIDAVDSSGRSVSSAGDINGDGLDDLIIGAPDAGSGGESYVVFGSSGEFARSLDLSTLDGRNGFVIQGIERGDRSGSSVSSAGDINGDGFDDLIIGATGADPNGNYSAGESYVVFGSSGEFARSLDLSTLDGRNGFVIQGIERGDSSGRSVSSAGDVNGDGFDDRERAKTVAST